MIVKIKNVYSDEEKTFQGDPQDIFEELVHVYGFLQGRSKDLETALQEIGRSSHMFIDVEE